MRARSRRPLGIEDVVAELRDQFGQRRCPRLDHVACDLVGIQHRHAELGEDFRDGALAAGDAAGECDAAGGGMFLVSILGGSVGGCRRLEQFGVEY